MKSIGVLKAVFNQEHLVDRVSQNINDYASPYIRTFIQDDCSQDATLKKYTAAAPAFTEISKTEVNGGARVNTSILLDRCDTDYLIFSAGDDFISTRTVKELLDFIQRNDSDIFITKAVVVSDDQAYPLTREQNINKLIKHELCKNSNLFEIQWKSSTDLLVAAATNPGFVWVQGMVIRTSLAKRAGFPLTGEVDDWGFLHNLAVISLTEKITITFADCILGIMSVQHNSMGSQVIKQLERQINAIHNHWDHRFKKAALINCLNKKLVQFKDDKFSYDDIAVGLTSALNKIS